MISLVGILNCTPDSFSDGDPSLSVQSLCDRACALIDDGADMIDIGGDSTRPGSTCVSDEEEWNRIEQLLATFAHRIPISIDTHKATIAQRAIECGARMINDVGGGADQDLLASVAASNVSLVCMCSATGRPHEFSSNSSTPLTVDRCVAHVSQWAQGASARMTAAGIPLNRQIIDTGLGAFLSPDPAVSKEILRRYWQIECPVKDRMLGCSRKGFLKTPHEASPRDRDALSALYSTLVATRCPSDTKLYLRIHNVALHRTFLDAHRDLNETSR